MTIRVYTISGAPRPWRVLLGLAFKRLPFDTVVLKASEGEHKTQKFLSLNPRGTVPVMVDGAVTIRDSIAALSWLDRAYPDPLLFGRTPDEAASIWHHTTEVSDYLRAAVDAVLTPIFFHNATIATPELLRAAYTAKVELAALENLLRVGPYLAGAAPSAIDAVAFPEVRLLQRAVDTKSDVMKAIGLHDLYKQFPRLGAWVTRIEALPGYEQTQPQHWKEAA